jgi:hypothetical protein
MVAAMPKAMMKDIIRPVARRLNERANTRRFEDELTNTEIEELKNSWDADGRKLRDNALRKGKRLISPRRATEGLPRMGKFLFFVPSMSVVNKTLSS